VISEFRSDQETNTNVLLVTVTRRETHWERIAKLVKRSSIVIVVRVINAEENQEGVIKKVLVNVTG